MTNLALRTAPLVLRFFWVAAIVSTMWSFSQGMDILDRASVSDASVNSAAAADVDLVVNLAPKDVDGNPLLATPGSSQMVWEATVHHAAVGTAVDSGLSISFSRKLYRSTVVCEATGNAVCPDPGSLALNSAGTLATATIPSLPGAGDPVGGSVTLRVVGYTEPLKAAAAITATATATAGPGSAEQVPATNTSVQSVTLAATEADVSVTKRLLPASEGGTDYNDWGDTLTYEITVEYIDGNVDELLGVGITDRAQLNTGSTTFLNMAIAAECQAIPADFDCPSQAYPTPISFRQTKDIFWTRRAGNSMNSDHLTPKGGTVVHRLSLTTTEPPCSAANTATLKNTALLSAPLWVDTNSSNNSETVPAQTLGVVKACPAPIIGVGATKTSDFTQPDGSEFDGWGDAIRYEVEFKNLLDIDITNPEFTDVLGNYRCCGGGVDPITPYIEATLLDPADPADPFAFSCVYNGSGNGGVCPEFTKYTTPFRLSAQKTILDDVATDPPFVLEAGKSVKLVYWVRFEQPACYPGVEYARIINTATSSTANATPTHTDQENPIRGTSSVITDRPILMTECDTFDVAVTKTLVSPAPDEVRFGEPVVYEMTWKNVGIKDAYVTIRDIFAHNSPSWYYGPYQLGITASGLECQATGSVECPEDLSFDETPVHTVFNGTCRCYRGTGVFSRDVVLPPQESITYRFTAEFDMSKVCNQVPGANRADFEVRTDVPGYTAYDNNPSNNSALSSLDLLPNIDCIDLVLQKSQSVTEIDPGVPFEYRLLVTNLAATTATNQVVADQLGSYLELIGTPTCSVVSGSATCPTDGVGVSGGPYGASIAAMIPSMPQGSSVRLTIPVSTRFRGSLPNMATVAPEDPDSQTYRELDSTNNIASVNVIADGEADLWIEKNVVPSDHLHLPDGVVAYSLVVGNNGPDDVAGVTVIDTAPESLTILDWTCEATAPNGCQDAGEGDIADRNVALQAGHTVTYTVYARVTGDGATASITNDASVMTPGSVRETDSENNTDSVTTKPAEISVSLIKSVASVDATVVKPENVVNAGDEISYKFMVLNDGNVHLQVSADSVSDPRVESDGISIVCPSVLLAPDESTECTMTGVYTVSYRDVLDGGIENSATVEVQPSDKNGDPLLLDPRDPNSTVDPLTDVSDTGTEPGHDNEAVEEVPYPEAEATTNPLGVKSSTTDKGDDPTTWQITPNTSMALVKSLVDADPTLAGPEERFDAGDRLTYSFAVTNTGNTNLAGVMINDARIGVAGLGCLAGVLPPGETVDCTTTVTYTLTQDDIHGGGVENAATATGTPVDGAGIPVVGLAPAVDVSDTGTQPAHESGEITTITDPGAVSTGNPLAAVVATDDKGDDPTTWEVDPDPSILLVKSLVGTDSTVAGPDDRFDAGDTLTYGFSVTNAGNVNLDDIRVTDSKLGLVGVACVVRLVPGETADCAATQTYSLTQADISGGGVENTATVVGTPVDGSGTAYVGVDPVSDVSDTGTEPAHESGVITTITDPGAVATGNPLAAVVATDDKGDDPTTWEVDPDPSIVLVKSLVATDPTLAGDEEVFDAGDSVTYGFTVTNTGNVKLADVEIDDPKLGLVDQSCAAAVAPGESVECAGQAVYVLTQDDIYAGGVENSAVATATAVDEGDLPYAGVDPASDVSDTGTEPTHEDEEIIGIADPGDVATGNPLAERLATDDKGDDPTTWEVSPSPRFTMTKSLVEADPTVVGEDDIFEAGDGLTYRFTVTNHGNVPLANVMIDDARIGVAGLVCVSELATGETAECDSTVTYYLTQDDIDEQGVENSATGTAVGVDGDGVPYKGIDPVTDVSDAGTEPASGAEEPVAITDPEAVGTANPLQENEATPETGDDPTTWSAEFLPRLVLVKSLLKADPTVVGSSTLFEVGDVLAYGFKVTNSGNVPLVGVEITDAKIGVTGPCVEYLAVGETADCTKTYPYAITMDDITFGGVENSAEATATPVTGAGDPIKGHESVSDVSDTGTNPARENEKIVAVPGPDPGHIATPNPLGGVEQTDDSADDPTTWLVEPVGRVNLVKSLVSADPSVRGHKDYFNVGDTITYKFHVTNTGNVPLFDLLVNDAKVGASNIPCVETLSVGKSADCSTELVYALAQADLDAGGVANTADVEGWGGDSLGRPIRGLQRVGDISDTGTEPAADDEGTDRIDSPDGIATRNPLGSIPETADPDDDPTIWMLTSEPPDEPSATDRILAFTGSSTRRLLLLGVGILIVGGILTFASAVRVRVNGDG